MRFRLVALLALAGHTVAVSAHAQLPPLTDQEVQEARTLIGAMKRDAKGPYLRLRWFCNDGTVHPPQGTPCRERGGGAQHAELNEGALRLAQLGFHVGTILQAAAFENLVDAERAYYRLREMGLIGYLEAVDDGWVLRGARSYRGARQIEDEERRGTAHLQRLLSDPAWTSRHFLLATQLVATMPHTRAEDEQLTDRIRGLATQVADLDSGFADLRVKIHSLPSRDDAAAVDRYLRAHTHSPDVRAKLEELRRELTRQYDVSARMSMLEGYRRRVGGALADRLGELEEAYRTGRDRESLSLIATLSPQLRDVVTAGADGVRNLLLLDLNLLLQEHAFLLGVAAPPEPAASRREWLAWLSDGFAIAYGAGFLSGRERQALHAEIARLAGATTVGALDYKRSVAYLARSLDWSFATARAVFEPAVQRYLRVEPKAAGFLDDLVRGSIMLPLAGALDRLGADADRVLGASHELLGERVSHGLRGLNPGVALLTLSILDSVRPELLEATGIYVLPATTPDLRPVGGILTRDEGNLLSHLQLLARNLGIPNASISSELLPRLRAVEGTAVFFAVTPLGRVLIKRPADLDERERRLVEGGREVRAQRVRLDTERLRLDVARPIPLAELRAEHSGVVVGPKAANLGQLAAYFPGRVSEGVALPFGMFYRHVDRVYGGAGGTVLDELRAAYGRAAAMREADASESEIDRMMFEALAATRTAIEELEWIPQLRQAVADAVRATFGPDLGAGVFVRSDTNVEDLPQFTGAGLNLTVPHQRSLEAILAAVKRVWTSPFSERAYLWRKQVLDEQGQVYPSVLLLRSVPSEKSGVLITSGLQHGGAEALTVVTAEGVGGAVEGEEAETLVLGPGHEVRVLSQTKAPYRRVLVMRGAGGVAAVPADLPDTLLTQGEIAQLRDVVREWKTRYAAEQANRIWDIEFGFVNGQLWLFQIRPFIRFRNSEVLDRLEELDRDLLRNAGRRVRMERAP